MVGKSSQLFPEMVSGGPPPFEASMVRVLVSVPSAFVALTVTSVVPSDDGEPKMVAVPSPLSAKSRPLGSGVVGSMEIDGAGKPLVVILKLDGEPLVIHPALLELVMLGPLPTVRS